MKITLFEIFSYLILPNKNFINNKQSAKMCQIIKEKLISRICECKYMLVSIMLSTKLSNQPELIQAVFTLSKSHD